MPGTESKFGEASTASGKEILEGRTLDRGRKEGRQKTEMSPSGKSGRDQTEMLHENVPIVK